MHGIDFQAGSLYGTEEGESLGEEQLPPELTRMKPSPCISRPTKRLPRSRNYASTSRSRMQRNAKLKADGGEDEDFAMPQMWGAGPLVARASHEGSPWSQQH